MTIAFRFVASMTALLAAFAAPAGATVISGPVTNPANGHRYYLLDRALWTEAEAEAITLGGHLVTHNDAAERDWLFDTFGFHTYWVGLNDVAQEGAFVWSSGETPAYTVWAPGEPAAQQSDWDYVVNTSGGWFDSPNDNFGLELHRGIAEVVPEPASIALLGLAGLAMVHRHRRP